MADETNQLRVRLVTPERIFFDHAAVAVELPAKNGYFEVLYGHAPLVAELGAGRRHHPHRGGPYLRRPGERAALQRQLGLCRGAGRPRHHSGQ
jgi:hypothetical protein